MINAVQRTSSSDNDERLWASLLNASVLSGFVIPLGNLLAPLIIWMLKKEHYPLVDDQGKATLNFQLTVFIGLLISAFLMYALVGLILFPLLLLYSLIMTIVASVKAYEGEYYRYPYSFTFIR